MPLLMWYVYFTIYKKDLISCIESINMNYDVSSEFLNYFDIDKHQKHPDQQLSK